ncbi:hypothetical protein PoB_006035500 [Plakobranchus ocellatus]|uniref:Uncharacterized protein n=1 Tax=Plakobranchus ocellatus TaxID=259542 RepID=A0AAV4CPQ5_9GAST|nr:hypothetical protein PoB_006035500 [Plakobranchus ocellatus]
MKFDELDELTNKKINNLFYRKRISVFIESRRRHLDKAVDTAKPRNAMITAFITMLKMLLAWAGEEANNENHTSEHTAASTNAPPTVSPSLLTEFVVTPLEVKRQKLATGYRFTVRYVPHAQNLRIVYINNTLTMSYDNDVVPNYIELQGTPDHVGGVQKITFERDFQAITPSGVNPHYVYFMTETERVGIKINIYPSHHDTLVTPVHLTEFTLTPAEQVVYQPGRNTEMLWANYSGWSYFNVKATVVDTSSGQAAVIKLVHHSRFFNTSYSNQYSTDVDKSIGGNILTASLTFSGYLDVTVGNFSLSNSSAVETLDVTKRLLLRPNTQTGPFPDGYLGFPRSQNRRELADGTPLLYCNST